MSFSTPGGAGSPGRARLEAFSNTSSVRFSGAATASVSGAAPTSLTLTNAPTLQIASVGGIAAPTTPAASLTTPDITLPAGTANPVAVSLQAANIPPGTNVTITVSGQMGGASSTSAPLAGTQASSTASASVTIPLSQPSVISATASFTLVAANGGPVFAQGEEVERVRVTASSGDRSQLVYITKSGREIQVR